MRLTLSSPLDMHLHLRDGKMLSDIAKYSARSFAGALIMPNLIPPITTIKALAEYKERILKSCGEEIFAPYMSLFFKESYTPKFLKEAKPFIAAIKLYPSGVTTNSKGGVNNIDIKKLAHILEAMSEFDIPLCIHGETNGFVMDREREFGTVYKKDADLKVHPQHHQVLSADDVKLSWHIDYHIFSKVLHSLLS